MISPTPECRKHAEGSKVCIDTDSEMFSATCPETDHARHISVFYLHGDTNGSTGDLPSLLQEKFGLSDLC